MSCCETSAPAQWSWQDPLLGIDSSRIRPDIAVIALLDQPTSALAQQAFAAREPDTAYAVLVHSSSMSDVERSGNLQLLGSDFESTGAFDLAALAYQQMNDLAALSPTMPDTMRAQSSLDAAEGFIRLERVDTAEPILRQAETLARYSPLMAPVQRQEVAVRLRDIYRQLGKEDQAQALDQLIREPSGLANRSLSARSVHPWLPRAVSCSRRSCSRPWTSGIGRRSSL